MLFKNSDDCNGKVFVSRKVYERAGVQCDESNVVPVVSLKLNDQYREMTESLRRAQGVVVHLEETAMEHAAPGACSGEREWVQQCYAARKDRPCTNCTQPVEAFVRCVRQLASTDDGGEECGEHSD